MKKWVNLVFVCVLVLGLFFTGSQNIASARPAEPLKPGLAPGEWEWTSAAVVGEEVAMKDILTKPAPWLQLITNGLEIKAPAKICHPFLGVQFGWTGSIYKLEGETWVKQVTTNNWSPSYEGTSMSCAQVTSAGTYALFGYWTKPEGQVDTVVEPFDCSTLNWNAHYSGIWTDTTLDPYKHYEFFIYNLNVPENTPVFYVVTDTIPSGVIIDGSGVVYIDSSGSKYIEVASSSLLESIDIELSVFGCTHTLQKIWND